MENYSTYQLSSPSPKSKCPFGTWGLGTRGKRRVNMPGVNGSLNLIHERCKAVVLTQWFLKIIKLIFCFAQGGATPSDEKVGLIVQTGEQTGGYL